MARIDRKTKPLMQRLAKLTAPALPRVLERTRLFRSLDRAIRNPITWIVGPPGAGKTTPVASYLKARRRRSQRQFESTRFDDSDKCGCGQSPDLGCQR